jgi:multiple sugar transport system substrate-binding protein/raffinose/stachyose/melibiose transport system substrate-binding protein
MQDKRLRRTRWLAGIGAAALLLAACAGQGNKEDDDEGSGGKTTIAFWNGFTGPDRAQVEGLVKKYNETQDKVEVKMTISPWDVFFQKLLPSIASGKGPDLLAMDSVQLPQYATRGVLAPLDDYYGDSGNESDKLVESAVKATEWEGKKYGVPMNFTTLLMYWNKDMFKAAGVADPKPGWTMDEFKAAARKLTAAGKSGLVTTPGDLGTMSWVRTMTGAEPLSDGKLNFTDPKFEQGFSQYADFVKTDKIAPQVPGGNPDFETQQFTGGKAAMQLNGPWSLIDTKGKV